MRYVRILVFFISHFLTFLLFYLFTFLPFLTSSPSHLFTFLPFYPFTFLPLKSLPAGRWNTRKPNSCAITTA